MASITGAAVGNQVLLTTGFAVCLLAIILLMLSSARSQNRRTQQIKTALARLEAKTVPAPSTPGKSAVSGLLGSGNKFGSSKAVGAEFEYASRMKTMQPHFETFALRSKSRLIRDSFARAATDGSLGYSDLLRTLAVIELGSGNDEMVQQVKFWQPSALLALARLAANQRSGELDLEHAAHLFAAVEKYFGTPALGRNDRLLYVEVLDDLGAAKALRLSIKRFQLKKKFPVHSSLLWANALGGTQGDESAWLSTVNAMYCDAGVSQIELDPGSAERIDRIVPASSAPVPDGPLVSIIVPTHNGSGLIGTAIASLIHQTWRNMEIIVVDDCSTEGHRERIAQLKDIDPRIMVLRQDENLGAYPARNLGLKHANGQFVTVHDDDDWSHPQKIELQVAHLMKNPDLPANMSHHARSTPALRFLRINNNPQFCQPNFSSLMVKTEVLKALGGWDAVNRGADAEFRDRLVAAYGIAIPVVSDVPLSFTRTREGSLTAGEMWRGYVSSSRLLYLAAYQRWHASATAPSCYVLNTGTERDFPVPSSMLPGKRGEHLGTFDVVFATDFRFPGGTSALTLGEVRAAAEAGLRIGVMQLDSPLNRTTDNLAEGLFEALSLPRVEIISLQDLADVKLLVVRHPSVATFLDGAMSLLRVSRCVLVVNNPPVLRGGKGMVFDLPTCVANLDRLFELQTVVVAESQLTRDLCRGLVAAQRIAMETWPGLVTMAPKTTHPPVPGTAVLGRHSRDHELKWPTRRRDFDAVYKSSNGAFKTVILGGLQSTESKYGENVASGITVHPFGSLNVEEYLNELHFWAYFHDDRLTESFGMAAAEAMAAGKVVILPPYMQKTFGEGAIYGQPQDVAALVEKYSTQPELFNAQSRLARATALREFSPDALLSRIDSFGVKASSAS